MISIVLATIVILSICCPIPYQDCLQPAYVMSPSSGCEDGPCAEKNWGYRTCVSRDNEYFGISIYCKISSGAPTVDTACSCIKKNGIFFDPTWMAMLLAETLLSSFGLLCMLPMVVKRDTQSCFIHSFFGLAFYFLADAGKFASNGHFIADILLRDM